MIPIQPVILCGGSGTRLWPLSRAGFPKQFLCLTGDESLFQLAAKRLMGLGADEIQVANPYIVSGEDHRFLAAEQLRETGIELGAALLEPVGRNTAPALTLAALQARESGADPILVVTPADQTVADQAAFSAAMQTAIREAATGSIVILGITPDRPETGYGYIQVEPEAEKSALTGRRSVLRFVEKPTATSAQNYLDQGDYYWNAGMFVLKASVWLNALQTHRPDIASACQVAWAAKTQDGTFIRPAKDLFGGGGGESIDYAVMEPLTAQITNLTPNTSNLTPPTSPLKMVPLSAQCLSSATSGTSPAQFRDHRVRKYHGYGSGTFGSRCG